MIETVRGAGGGAGAGGVAAVLQEQSHEQPSSREQPSSPDALAIVAAITDTLAIYRHAIHYEAILRGVKLWCEREMVHVYRDRPTNGYCGQSIPLLRSEEEGGEDSRDSE